MDLIEDIARDGFAGPFSLLTPTECAGVLRKLTRKRRRKKVWSKASAAVNRPFHTIASDARILDLVRAVLGEDIILWGGRTDRQAS